MKAIWTQAQPSYAGEFVNFTPMETGPKPLQKPPRRSSLVAPIPGGEARGALMVMAGCRIVCASTMPMSAR